MGLSTIYVRAVLKADRQNRRSYPILVALLLALLLASPVAAEENPGGGALAVQPIPLPLPLLPAPVEALPISALPALNLPAQHLPSYPSAVGQISALGASLDASMLDVRNMMNAEFATLNGYMARTRTTTARARAMVGSPLELTVNPGGGMPAVTVYSAAADMAGGMSTSMMYLRGLSRIGTTGLDLAFVMVGLLWLTVVNLVYFLFEIGFAVGKFLLRVIAAILRFVELLMGMIQTIRAMLPIP